MSGLHDLQLLNWRLRSELPIEVLPPWAGPADHAIDITFTLGEVAEFATQGPVDVQILADESAIIIAEGVGRFHISDGRHVVVQSFPGVYPGALETALIGPVLGTLCCQREILALHCNTVVINGKAVALTGNSGAGKSTLAAVLASRGHPLISDDVLPVTYNDGKTTAYTGNRNLRLWRESLELLGHDVSRLRRAAIGDRDKYFLPQTGGQIASSWPLAALIWIDITPVPTEVLAGLSGIFRLRVIGGATYRSKQVREYASRNRPGLTDLSLPGVDVYVFKKPHDLSRIERHADAIEALFSE